MAISKILCIGSCGSGYPGKHLRQALDYITAPEKTGNWEWVAALNCQKENVYDQMRRTKAAFILGRILKCCMQYMTIQSNIHGHVIFNSVSFRNGKKYCYEKGDWAEKIQPIVNRLCEEYGLSTINISTDREKHLKNIRNGMIQRMGASYGKT